MECKQSHAVKCPVNHQKYLVDHHSKQTHMGTHLACMHNWSCDLNTLYKSDGNGGLTHNCVDHHAGSTETTKD